MPQLTVSQNAIIAQPGMAFDAEASARDVISLPAATNIPFGAYVEITAAGACQVLQDSTTGAAFLPSAAGGVKPGGVALFDALGVEQAYQAFQVPASTTGSSASGWLKGMLVPVLRRGRIWVLGDASGTQLNYGPINVHHSSTGANPQGVFTFLAISATVGNEIDIAPSAINFNPTLVGGTTGISTTDPFGNVFKVYPVEMYL
jgi:hypothetical protein